MSQETQKGAQPPVDEHSSEPEKSAPRPASDPNSVSYQPSTDDPYNYHDDPYAYEEQVDSPAAVVEPPKTQPAGPPPPPPSPPKAEDDADDGDEEGMLRMSFLEHLEELRSRIIWALGGLGVAFALSVAFANRLWLVVTEPAADALKRIGADPNLIMIDPMDGFMTIWVKLPLLAALFLASPWILYQVWAFIAPGLYKRERRWAAPFVISTAGLFILGGLFAYFIAFRYGLAFLLGIGQDIRVRPQISIVYYLDLFINVMLGIGLVFELPVLIFFLTLIRVTSPAFLMRNARYAILGIVILAAIVTPTPDVFNLVLFAAPMILLFFVGVFASYILVLRRENRKFPWAPVLIAAGVAMLVIAGGVSLAITKYGFRLVPEWPFLTR